MSEPPATVNLESPEVHAILGPSTASTSYNGNESNSDPLQYPSVSQLETGFAPYSQLNLTGMVSLPDTSPCAGGVYCEIYQGQLDGQPTCCRATMEILFVRKA